MDVELILRAAAFAAKAHEKQKRKIGSIPYINHLIRVAHGTAAAGLPAETVAAAFLHDVVEDTRITLEEVRRRFPDRVAHLVHLMTQWWPDDAPPAVKERERPKYYAAILEDPDAIHLKLLDRADNLHDMVRAIPQSRRWAENFCRRSKEEMSPLYDASDNEFVRAAYAAALEHLQSALAKGAKPAR
jgi:(p)ppGpp synthase/HD superfamily hydrolase